MAWESGTFSLPPPPLPFLSLSLALFYSSLSSFLSSLPASLSSSSSSLFVFQNSLLKNLPFTPDCFLLFFYFAF